MNETTMTSLISLAVFLGLMHSVMGPDHYIPFLAMARAGRWSIVRTLAVVGFCGLGHVLSSVIIGLIGVVLGMAVGRIESIESFREDIAGWLLIFFGVAFTIYGIRQMKLNRPHSHHFPKIPAIEHIHDHDELGGGDECHDHKQDSCETYKVTIWALFLIFVFCPSGPLIPQLMYPAAKGDFSTVIVVAASYSVTTILTMMILVAAGYYGLKKLPPLERYTNIAAGIAIIITGILVKIGL